MFVIRSDYICENIDPREFFLCRVVDHLWIYFYYRTIADINGSHVLASFIIKKAYLVSNTGGHCVSSYLN